MKDTALLLIGYQNDYFSKQGILRSYVEESDETLGIVNNTIEIIKTIDDILIISTPIRFSKDYNELVKPEGILKKIKEAGAFQKGKKGSKLISEFKPYEDDILEVPGKHGLNAFIGTDLDLVLKKNKIKNVALAGCICSVCVDSTGRSAYEKGYRVIMISDCISGRTDFEQKFYCEEIFPLYSEVKNHKRFIKDVK